MNKLKKYIPIILASTPLFALAVEDIYELIYVLKYILNYYVIPLLMAVALVVFLYGVIKYITAGGNEEKRAEGRMTMIYGIIGLFVMVAIWGLVWLLLNTFNLDTGRPDYPEFEF